MRRWAETATPTIATSERSDRPHNNKSALKQRHAPEPPSLPVRNSHSTTKHAINSLVSLTVP